MLFVVLLHSLSDSQYVFYIEMRKSKRRILFFLSFSLLLLALFIFNQRSRVSSSIADSRVSLDAVDSKLGNTEELQREKVYSAYHEGRKDTCDGCRYIPFNLRMYPRAKSIFDVGAANCGVMRLLEAKGFEVEGIEYSDWVVNNFYQDFLHDPKRVEIGPVHMATNSKAFDLVLCTDVLEHIPIKDISSTLYKISNLVKPGGDVFLVIASDPSKHENHPERSTAATELKQSGLKIHETVQPRSWWLLELSRYGLEEDKEAMSTFLRTNQEKVHDPRYGYSIPNFKNRGRVKVYEPNKRHVDRVYCLKKNI